MNKTLFILLLLVLFVLTACTSANQSAAVTLTENYANSISVEQQLIVGTFKLEGTDLAIDSQTASQLLPLWSLLKELKSSGSAADQEISAVEEQIQGTMTAEQVKAIRDMKLTQADIAAIFQGQNSSSGSNSGAVNQPSSSGSAAGPVGGAADGNAPPAGGPAGGGFDPGGGPILSQQNNSAGKSQSSMQTGSTVMIGEVIKLLESKVQG